MMKLILLLVVIAAGWYGWNNYPQILNRQPGHKAVIVNQTGRDIQRVRLVVDGQTLVREMIADGAEAELPFKVANDSDFKLIWQWTNAPGEFQWRGGRIPRGPMVQKHLFIVHGVNEVVYQTRPL